MTVNDKNCTLASLLTSRVYSIHRKLSYCEKVVGRQDNRGKKVSDLMGSCHEAKGAYHAHLLYEYVLME